MQISCLIGQGAGRGPSEAVVGINIFIPTTSQVQWLKLLAWKVWDRGFEPYSGIQVSKKQKFLPRSLERFTIVGTPEAPRPLVSVLGLRSPGIEYNFETCVWRAVSCHSSHHPQKVLLTQFSLCVHNGGLTYICQGAHMDIPVRIFADVPGHIFALVRLMWLTWVRILVQVTI